MEDKQEVTVPMPGSLHDRIVDELEYGDSKAGWIREAIEMRLEEPAPADSEAADPNNHRATSD
mgnify:CR=1 FL=1